MWEPRQKMGIKCQDSQTIKVRNLNATFWYQWGVRNVISTDDRHDRLSHNTGQQSYVTVPHLRLARGRKAVLWFKENIRQKSELYGACLLMFYDKNMSSLVATSVYMRFTEAFNVQCGKSLQISIWVTCWLSPSFLCSIRQEIPRIFVDLWQSDTPLWALEVSKLEGDLSKTAECGVTWTKYKSWSVCSQSQASPW